MSEVRTLDELTASLELAFSIDAYLELRRRFPEEDTALWMVMGSNGECSFGMDFAFQLQPEFRKFGIPVETFLGTLDGDPDEIDRLCLLTLEALSKREKLERHSPHAVATGLAIGDAFVNFLCGAILECLSYYQMSPPHSYQILIKCRLRLFENSIKEQRVNHERQIMIAHLMSQNPGAGVREIARMTGMNASSISRWLANEKFLSYVRMFGKIEPQTATHDGG